MRWLPMLLLAGCSSATSSAPTIASADKRPRLTMPKNVVYSPASGSGPKVRLIPLPEHPRANAIWGALGRDHLNTIYVGLSTREGGSARLLTVNPGNDAVTDLGSVVDHLARVGKPAPSQNKIHTKVFQCVDANVYFASMDETGEREDGTQMPTHGSHLWRLRPGVNVWEHLGHRPEAIIASAVGGRFVYFLGYPGHVLHQYDTTANQWASLRVGSVGGHTTRNFFANDRGHVFVPRVTSDWAELVEIDDELKELRAFPLQDYSRSPDASSHGLVGIAAQASGGWVFVTDRGRLYRLEDRIAGTMITDLGWLHPKGESYAACLFCLDGQTQLAAAVNVVPRGEPRYEWVIFNLNSKQTTAKPLEFPAPPGVRDMLVYGSITRDDAGRCYVGGCGTKGDGTVPLLWCIEP